MLPPPRAASRPKCTSQQVYCMGHSSRCASQPPAPCPPSIRHALINTWNCFALAAPPRGAPAAAPPEAHMPPRHAAANAAPPVLLPTPSPDAHASKGSRCTCPGGPTGTTLPVHAPPTRPHARVSSATQMTPRQGGAEARVQKRAGTQPHARAAPPQSAKAAPSGFSTACRCS